MVDKNLKKHHRSEKIQRSFKRYHVSKTWKCRIKMAWFKDKSGHVIESKNRIHRLLYCSLCHKLIFKVECQKLRQDKNGSLYPVKRYHYDRLSKMQRAERKEERELKRLRELPNAELSKIVHRIL